MKFVAIIAMASNAMVAPAMAKDLFDITISTEGVTSGETFASAVDFFDRLENSVFSSLSGAYTETSVATARANFRGLPFVIEYRDDTAALHFTSSVIDIDETFVGADRDESENLFIDYLQSNDSNITQKITDYTVSQTATDPVAGNPSSLVDRTAAADFSSSTSVGGTLPATSSVNSAVAFGARLGRFTVGDQETSVYDLPIRYFARLTDDGYGIVFDAPITIVSVEEAYSYSGSIGLGVRLPILPYWTLTPGARIGAVGSADLGALAYVYDGSLTSNVTFAIDEFQFSVGNAVTLSQTASVTVDDYEIDYEVANTIFRNGVGVVYPTDITIFDMPTTADIAIVNTTITGDDVYIDQYTDIALSIGLADDDENSLYNLARFGLTYSFGAHDYSGLTVNFGYQF
ncbi:hypothetical protein [Zavarzinia aquatilis]|uniref:Autotransporter domain-containing protein n=1 Tax=Zavarzinia aquatilis TaxID=2211142 RepID=A0A317EFT9_9PROT|nr:hypothetical protein [Zavarzinia aquatilis]PWR25719.1 hypothetical protein DKG74_01800 [Zavarzinia aquatilis]